MGSEKKRKRTARRKSGTDVDDAMPAPSNGVPTSDDAAAAIEKDSGRLRRLVFRTIHQHMSLAAGGGLTCQEIEGILHLRHETVSARVWELHTRGFIVDSGRTRLTKAKRKAIVWVVPKKKSDGMEPSLSNSVPVNGSSQKDNG